MITVACVLKSGGIYTPDHVRILEAMVSRNLDGIDRFVCLTDIGLDLPHVEPVKLYHNWPGAWSKLELFRPVFDEGARVLYFDLDCVITENLGAIAGIGDPFVAYHRPRLWSSVMLWTAGHLINVYRNFARRPHGLKTVDDVITLYAPRPAWWEDVLPGRIETYHAVHDRYSTDMKVMAFRGSDKPWNVQSPGQSDWIAHHYTAEVPV